LNGKEVQLDAARGKLAFVVEGDLDSDLARREIDGKGDQQITRRVGGGNENIGIQPAERCGVVEKVDPLDGEGKALEGVGGKAKRGHAKDGGDRIVLKDPHGDHGRASAIGEDQAGGEAGRNQRSERRRGQRQSG
jgi:hypothetical protein